MKFGCKAYAFDPRDAWDPDFPRCPVCGDEISPGKSVVDAGNYREAHEYCVKKLAREGASNG